MNSVDNYKKSMTIFKEKIEVLTAPNEYKKLLKPINLSFISTLLLPVLVPIVEEYYSLLDREIFISRLLQL